MKKKCINRFEELENEFIRELQKMAEYVIRLTEELHNIGKRMIQKYRLINLSVLFLWNQLQ